ncbi:MAG TPA: PEP-CTERM sorting domain-containing protein [bacterium]
MKWIKNLSMAAGHVGMAVSAIGMAATGAQAAPTAVTGSFVMYNNYGTTGAPPFNQGPVGTDATVTGFYDSTVGTWGVSSNVAFFGHKWTAHGGTLLHPGHYTISTTQAAGAAGPSYQSFTVPAGHVGGHILFDWNTAAGIGNSNIDVLILWDAAGTSIDGDGAAGGLFPDLTPIFGVAMIDGPFAGFSANFNLSPAPQFSGPVIPEPMSMALVGSSLLGLAGLRRRFRA